MALIRVVFMGTPDFAVNPLKALIDKVNVVLVVTKKDAEVGRKKILTKSPVKAWAMEHNIPVLTPDKLKLEYQEILDYKPDLIVTCAYGKILPKEILAYPRLGCINIHASLLPKYRGSAPIQWALLNGEDTTGVTLMYMDEGMDTGDIIATSKYVINSSDDVGILHDKLSEIGSKLLLDNLDNIINGQAKRIKQDEDAASYAPMIERDMEELNFNASVRDVYNKIRAFSPWPLAKTTINGVEVKIIKAHYQHTKSEINKLYMDKNSLGIGCTDGIIYFDIVKPSGKKEMPIKNYLNGLRSN